MSGVAELTDFVRAGGLFVLTGAGISTESGIPDYRRPDGTRRTVPMTYQQFLATHEARQRYWARSAVGWEIFDAAEPNVGHVALARLQGGGLVDHLVTQNVDGLHARAGARAVTELHGSLEHVSASRAGRGKGAVASRYACANSTPSCRRRRACSPTATRTSRSSWSAVSSCRRACAARPRR